MDSNSFSRRNLGYFILGLFALGCEGGKAKTGNSAEAGATCPTGDLDCACYPNLTCNSPLECSPGGICAHALGTGGIDASDTCYQPEGPISYVAACGQTSLCLAANQTTEVDGSHCKAATCRWTFMGNSGDTLTFDSGDTWVFLRFGAGSITGATTTVALASAFQHVSFYRTFPTTGGTPRLTAEYFEGRTGIGAFDLFELKDGLLHVRLSFTIKEPFTRVFSSDSACYDLDVRGQCICSYGGVSIPAVIDITLPADIPGS